MDILDQPRPDDKLCSAVHAGSLLNIQQAIQELEEAGSPVTLSRAIVTSISIRNIDVLRLLLSYGDVDEEVAEAAATSESIQFVQVILNHGWSINRNLRRGLIPSVLRQRSLAIRNGNFLDELLSLGADPNAESNLGETALSFAIREGTMKVIRRLLGAGTDVSRGDLLHCASRRESSKDTYELIVMLIQKGVAVDSYQWENEKAKMMRYGYPQGTALHIACKEGNFPAAQALLEYGADPRRLKKRCGSLVPPSPFDVTTPHSPMRSLLERHM
ncbi:hypothetical protein AC578_320 [Pseudocercospora eumusae]|uniref:Uncharacterized protein n=1 Tax=Pseudocercospora eumusae TaxID=321146 RepID=A0A139HU12_9PEZI|nr:hypothetical protein AC578_320 [Pseudocercospora eumusae]